MNAMAFLLVEEGNSSNLLRAGCVGEDVIGRELERIINEKLIYE